MNVLDRDRLVVELACLVQDRSGPEHRALLDFAADVDRRANRLTVTNRRTGPAWRLHRYAAETRVLVDRQRPVTLSDEILGKLDRQADLWDEFHDAVRHGRWTPEKLAAVLDAAGADA